MWAKKQSWQNELIKIFCFETFESYSQRKNDPDIDLFTYNYCIFIPEKILSGVADFLDMDVFHKKNNFQMSFTGQNRKEFVEFKDFHIHALILYILNTEFNLEFYLESKVIQIVMPIHEFRTRELIGKLWNKEKWEMVTDNFKLKTSSKDYRPINAVAYYYGCDYAYYLSFIQFVTSNLLYLTTFGLIFLILNWTVHGFNYDN